MDDPTIWRRELLNTAERLVHEFETVAAGSVLRCFSRSVRRLHRDGISAHELGDRAEDLVRERMHRRGVTSGGIAA